MKILPKKFTITITENDRLLAGDFTSDQGCLVETALRRRGYKKVLEMVSGARVDGLYYDHEWLGTKALCFNDAATKAPFYEKAVVGKKITFTRQ